MFTTLFYKKACFSRPSTGEVVPAQRVQRKRQRLRPEGGGRAPPTRGPCCVALSRRPEHARAAQRAQLQPENHHCQGARAEFTVTTLSQLIPCLFYESSRFCKGKIKDFAVRDVKWMKILRKEVFLLLLFFNNPNSVHPEGRNCITKENCYHPFLASISSACVYRWRQTYLLSAATHHWSWSLLITRLIFCLSPRGNRENRQVSLLLLICHTRNCSAHNIALIKLFVFSNGLHTLELLHTV